MLCCNANHLQFISNNLVHSQTNSKYLLKFKMIHIFYKSQDSMQFYARFFLTTVRSHAKLSRNYASQFEKSDQKTQNHTNENKTKLTSKEIWGLPVTLTATIPVNCINRKKIN